VLFAPPLTPITASVVAASQPFTPAELYGAACRVPGDTVDVDLFACCRELGAAHARGQLARAASASADAIHLTRGSVCNPR
jgi:hypothetical protein